MLDQDTVKLAVTLTLAWLAIGFFCAGCLRSDCEKNFSWGWLELLLSLMLIVGGPLAISTLFVCGCRHWKHPFACCTCWRLARPGAECRRCQRLLAVRERLQRSAA